MVHNGVPLKVKVFNSENSVNGVLDFYRGQWRDHDKTPVENTVGEWRIIGRQLGDHYLTVQARRHDNGSEGFLAVSTLPAALDGEFLPNTDTPFPRLPGSDVLTNTVSYDLGKRSTTLVFENQASSFANASYYRSNLPVDGWLLRQNDDAQLVSNKGYTMYFEKQGQACHVVITNGTNGGTLVTVNLVTKPSL